jgi:hypothetical protein
MISFYSLTTANGSAVAPQDYDRLVDYEVTFAINETNKCVNVTINDDNILEYNQTFTIIITSNAAVLINNLTNVTITSEDQGESGVLPWNPLHVLQSHRGHLEKTYCLSPLNLTLKSFQSRPRGAEQLILFSWD